MTNFMFIIFCLIYIIVLRLTLRSGLFVRPKQTASCSQPTRQMVSGDAIFALLKPQFCLLKAVCIICIWVYAPCEAGLLLFF